MFVKEIKSGFAPEGNMKSM